MGNHLCRDLTHRDLAREAVRKSITTIIEAKEPLMKTLNKYVKLVRSEHCFLLFEELGKIDKWLQCLEVFRWCDGCVWEKWDDQKNRMKSNQCKPNIITFNLLIDSYGKKQAFEKMEQVFKSLLHSKEKPTLSTFNSMIINYEKARLREKAENVFKKLTEMKYSPSFITYESLIMMNGYCDCVTRAREIFDEMVKSGKEMKVSTLNAMLDVYCMNGLPMEADMLFENTHKMRVAPDSSTYKLLYKAYTKANMKELVQKLLKHMDKDCVVPNKRFFLEALEAFGSVVARPESASVRTDLRRSTSAAKT